MCMYLHVCMYMYVCNERENVNLVVKEVLYMYVFVHRGGFHSIYDITVHTCVYHRLNTAEVRTPFG